MKRREFIAGTAALLASPRRSWAQGPPRRVGYLDSAPLYLPNFKVWQDSVRDHGAADKASRPVKEPTALSPPATA